MQIVDITFWYDKAAPQSHFRPAGASTLQWWKSNQTFFWATASSCRRSRSRRRRLFTCPATEGSNERCLKKHENTIQSAAAAEEQLASFHQSMQPGWWGALHITLASLGRINLRSASRQELRRCFHALNRETFSWFSRKTEPGVPAGEQIIISVMTPTSGRLELHLLIFGLVLIFFW